MRTTSSSLFNPPIEATPRARNTDPDTSHQAAAMMRDTGTAKKHGQIVYEQIIAGPGRTAGELAAFCPFDSAEVTRRIADLRESGLVESRDSRKCSVKGRKMQTHWPVKQVEGA